MRCHQFTAEDREEKLTTEARAQFSALTRAALAKDPAATKRIVDALGDYLGDGNALADLVHAELLDRGAFQKVLTDVIWTEAGELAEAEVKRMERHRAESRDESRIDMAEQAAVLH